MKKSLTIMVLLASFSAILVGFSGKTEAETSKGKAKVSDVSDVQQPNVPKGWMTSYDGALALAKKENRPVLIDFTGSDWCGWCKKMKKDTYAKPEFTSFAKDNLVLLYVDFPNGKPQTDALKAQNKKLKGEYGVRGFPTQVLISPEGEVLWQNTGYLSGGPEALLTAINKAKA